MGNLRTDAGEWDRAARAYYLEALDIMTRVHDELEQANRVVSDLGLVARETGQCEEALRFYEQSLVLMRRLSNQGGVADAWRMMGQNVRHSVHATKMPSPAAKLANRSRAQPR